MHCIERTNHDMSQPLTPKRRKKENPVTVATISLNEGHPKTVTTLGLSLIRSNIVTRLLGAAEAEEEEGLVKKGVRMVFIRYKFAVNSVFICTTPSVPF